MGRVSIRLLTYALHATEGWKVTLYVSHGGSRYCFAICSSPKSPSFICLLYLCCSLAHMWSEKRARRWSCVREEERERRERLRSYTTTEDKVVPVPEIYEGRGVRRACNVWVSVCVCVCVCVCVRPCLWFHNLSSFATILPPWGFPLFLSTKSTSASTKKSG
jgi:hypothetical protein